MKYIFAPVAAVLLCATSTAAQLTINTPLVLSFTVETYSLSCHMYSLSVVVCQHLLITWSGGTRMSPGARSPNP